MHEFAVTQALLKQVIDAAEKVHVSNVTEIVISLGEYTSFVDESIQFYWSIIAKDSIAAQASIKINRIPGKITCLQCKKILKPGQLKPDVCPYCQSYKLLVTGGDELLLEEISFYENDKTISKKNH